MATPIKSLISILGILLLGASPAWSQVKGNKDEFIKSMCGSYVGTPKANARYYADYHTGYENRFKHEQKATFITEKWIYIIPIEGNIENVRPEETIKSLLALDYFNKSKPHLYTKEIDRYGSNDETVYEPPQDSDLSYDKFTTYDKNNRKVTVTIFMSDWWRGVDKKTRTLVPWGNRGNFFCDFNNMFYSKVGISKTVNASGVVANGVQINAIAVIFRHNPIAEVILPEIRF
jgi:hypothetical protein